MVNYTPARWSQDQKGRVQYVYDVGEAHGDCDESFIVPRDGAWWIVDTRADVVLAGPFINMISAKAGWRLIYG